MTRCLTTMGELSAYADGELTMEEELALRLHIDGCSICQQMTKVLGVLKETVTSNAETYPLPRTLRVALQMQPPPRRWGSFSRGLFFRRGLLVTLFFLMRAVG